MRRPEPLPQQIDPPGGAGPLGRRMTPLAAERIAEALSRRYSRAVLPSEVRSLNGPEAGHGIADATLKFLVPGPDGQAAFMIVSGEGNVGLVARGVANLGIARRRVSERTALRILLPLVDGSVDAHTFAVWPLHVPFLTGGRLRWLLRRRLYAACLLDWTYALGVESLRDTLSEDTRRRSFEVPLSRIADDAKFPPDMRKHADRARERLSSGAWTAMQCVQHGDLWAGNFLLSAGGGGSPDFYVIDWAGMKPDGYPMFDFARLAMSLRCGAATSRRYIGSFCEALRCDPQDATSYALAAIGDLGANLEYFPEPAYREMSTQVFRFLEAHRGGES